MSFKKSLFSLIAMTVFAYSTLFATFQTAPVEALARSEAQISFTFDDGYFTHINAAAPILERHGYTGTSYIATDYINLDEYYMNWNQVRRLQNKYGWEIGSHTVTHPLLTEQSSAAAESEIVRSKQILENQGLDITSFATPFGDYNTDILSTIAKNYDSHRPFHDVGVNTYPYSDYYIQVRQVQMGVSVNQVRSYIRDAVANGTWLVLVFHDIQRPPLPDPEEFEYSPENLSSIAKYAKEQGIKGVNISEALDTLPFDTILDTNFEGDYGGWTTDSAAQVSLDGNSNGNANNPTGSMKLVNAPTGNVHVYSPMLAINPAKEYLLKSYLNVKSMSAGGEIALYIDEFDENSNWVSGQYKVAERSAFVEKLNTGYLPSSSSVKQARIQVIVTAGSGTEAYLDNVQLKAIN